MKNKPTDEWGKLTLYTIYTFGERTFLKSRPTRTIVCFCIEVLLKPNRVCWLACRKQLVIQA